MPVQTISLPADYFDHLARIESGGRPYIKARTSSASGLYQFIRATWIRYGGTWGPDMSKAFGGLSPSIDEQRKRAYDFTRDNSRILAAAGIAITNQNLYAAHFLGVGTALKILSAPAVRELDDVLSAAVIKANAFLEPMKVADFRAWLDKKMRVKV